MSAMKKDILRVLAELLVGGLILLGAVYASAQVKEEPPAVVISGFRAYRVNGCQVLEFWLRAPAGRHFLECRSPQFVLPDYWLPVTILEHPGGDAFYRVNGYNDFDRAAFFRVQLNGKLTG